MYVVVLFWSLCTSSRLAFFAGFFFSPAPFFVALVSGHVLSFLSSFLVATLSGTVTGLSWIKEVY